MIKPTDKQQRFIDEYCGDQNKTQVYKRAGYKSRSEKAAGANASRLYANPIVRAAIDAKLKILAEQCGMKAQEAFAILAAIGRGDISNFLVITGAVPRMMAANEISKAAWKSAKTIKCKRYVDDEEREVEIIEYKLSDRVPALALILKALGELKETTVHTGPGGGLIAIEAEVNIVDGRKEIVSFVEDFRQAAARNLAERAAEQNGQANGDSHGA
jgi:phage terminase small subunit